MKRVTYQDIATKLGISKATVGYALNNNPKISKTTRDAVKKAAKELGHRPDPALSALSKFRWGAHKAPDNYSIAVIIMHTPQLSTDKVATLEAWNKSQKTPVGPYKQAYQAIRDTCESLGYICNFFHVLPTQSLKDVARTLYQRGTNGIIFHHNDIASQWTFPMDKFSSIVMGQGNPKCPTHIIAPDWYGSMKLALKQCNALGYRKIGFAHMYRGAPDTDDRFIASYHYHIRAFTDSPLPIFVYPEKKHPVDFDAEQKRFAQWFEVNQPDVVLDGSYFAYWWLKNLNLKVPDAVGLVHLFGALDDRHPEVACIDFQYDEIGKWAINLLGRLIQMNEKGLPDCPIRTTVPCKWISGKSLRST